MSAIARLIQPKLSAPEASTLEHTDKLLAIYSTMDKYLIYEYCHAHTGMSSGENRMYLAPKTVERFKGKRVGGSGRLDQNGKEIKEYCQGGLFVNANGLKRERKAIRHYHR